LTIIGKYLAVWKKQPDGSWLVVADMFNAESPPAS
jgi:ketosteroid isomerase-like protein